MLVIIYRRFGTAIGPIFKGQAAQGRQLDCRR